MTISLIIFVVTLLIGGSVLLNKRREKESGDPYFMLGTQNSDEFLGDLGYRIEYFLARTDMKTIRMYIKRVVLWAENYTLRALRIVGQRFEVVGHTITGKNIPKNRGSVSFFLKNIEEHKKEEKKGKQGLIN